MAKTAMQERVERSAMTRTVRRYLEALEAGYDRPADTGRLQARLDQIVVELDEASPVRRLKLIQERMDMQRALEVAEVDYGFGQLEADAVTVLAEWAQSKGITYQALRAGGVPARVLREAGIRRSAG